jgi:hypothetical protein
MLFGTATGRVVLIGTAGAAPAALALAPPPASMSVRAPPLPATRASTNQHFSFSFGYLGSIGYSPHLINPT